MAINVLNTSTLSEALSVDTFNFTVGSTANITVGNYLGILGTAGFELVKVQEIPVSGRVKVMRGVGGTKAFSHKSGAKFLIGDPDDFTTVLNSSPNQYISLTGFPPTGITQYAVPGTLARDGAGNAYICVELTATVTPGATVLISKDGNFTASVLTSDGVGNVGLMVENATSDQYAWAQVYGFYDHAKLVGGSSLVSSLGEFQGATSVSTPSVGLLGRSSSQRSSDYLAFAVVNGMFPVSAASTASTSASSETGLFCSAWLNYPYIQRAITS